jgi:gliding motility-associated-like protein
MKPIEKKIIKYCVILFLCLITKGINAQAVSTAGGSAGVSGFINGNTASARFNNPSGIACDGNGNIYIADRSNNCIRKIDQSGNISTLAGSGTVGATDGTGTAASFFEPWAVACDSSGNIYVADTKNYKIRKITAAGTVTTVAGQGTFGTTNGPALLSKFGFPSGLCVTPDGSIIYVADHNTHVIRKIENGTVSNLTGIPFISGSDDGAPGTATFNHPYGIELDNVNNIIVADEWNNKIREVSPSGNVITIAGNGVSGSTDGQGNAASFNSPWDVATDTAGNIFVADGVNNTVREIYAQTFFVSTYAGTAGITGAADGTGAAASFSGPSGIGLSRTNNTIYIGDMFNHLIRKITAVSSLQMNISTTAAANTFCFGDSISLTASLTNLNNYLFYINGSVAASSSNGSAMLAPLPAGNYTASCTATDGQGLTVFSSTINIIVKPQFVPGVSPASPVTFCNGDSTILTAQSASSYLWSTGATTQNIYISTAGNYTLTVTGSDGCRGSTVINATTTAGPAAAISPNGSTVICAGDSVLLTASSGSSWLWSNGSTTQSIYASAEQSYIVTVSNSTGCVTASAPVDVSFFAGSQATTTPSGTSIILQGDSLVLTASTGNIYNWSNGSSLSSITVANAGNYSVTVSSSNGCVSTSTPVTVVVITTQQMINLVGSNNICQGDSVMLHSYFSSNNQWYYNGTIIPGATDQNFAATDSGYYKVSAIQNAKTYFSDSILISVRSTPQIADVTDTTFCAGLSPLLVASVEPLVTVGWYDQYMGGNLLGSGSAYQTNAVTQNITLYIEVTGANGCKAERAALNVSVNPSPIADFSYTSSGTSGNYGVSFNNLTTLGDYYLWSWTDDTGIVSSTLINPTATFNSAGEHQVTLYALNASGCTDSITRIIYAGAANDWFIPNTFTPDNDGKNDIFRVRGKGVVTKEMNIYDQWGSLIYHGGSDAVWDGKVNGQVVQNSTYMYKITIEKDSEQSVVNGAITVIK